MQGETQWEPSIRTGAHTKRLALGLSSCKIAQPPFSGPKTRILGQMDPNRDRLKDSPTGSKKTPAQPDSPARFSLALPVNFTIDRRLPRVLLASRAGPTPSTGSRRRQTYPRRTKHSGY